MKLLDVKVLQFRKAWCVMSGFVILALSCWTREVLYQQDMYQTITSNLPIHDMVTVIVIVIFTECSLLT